MRGPKTPELIAIGTVGRAHGLRGAFFVSGREEPVPMSYGEVYIGRDSQDVRRAKLVQSFVQAGRPALVVDLAKDRTAAETLTGLGLFASREAVEADREDGELFWDELEGAPVVDVDGVELGVVTEVYNAGASDIIEVRREANAVDIPLIEDYVDFDRSEAGKIVLCVRADTFADAWYPVRD